MSDEDLCVLAYVSSAVRPFSREALVALLEASRQRNATVGITGLLLYHDGNFMQALEGPRAAVRTLFDRIERDPRHRGTLVLLDQGRTERYFPEWAMGFRDLSGADVPEGYSGLLNDDAVVSGLRGHPDRVHRLLQSFADVQLRRRSA